MRDPSAGEADAKWNLTVVLLEQSHIFQTIMLCNWNHKKSFALLRPV